MEIIPNSNRQSTIWQSLFDGNDFVVVSGAVDRHCIIQNIGHSNGQHSSFENYLIVNVRVDDHYRAVVLEVLGSLHVHVHNNR